MTDPRANADDIQTLRAEMRGFRGTVEELNRAISDLRTFMDRHHNVAERLDRNDTQIQTNANAISRIQGVGAGLMAILIILQVLILTQKLGA